MKNSWIGKASEAYCSKRPKSFTENVLLHTIFFSFSNEHCTSHAHLPYSSGEDFSRIQVDGRIRCGDGKFAQHHEDQLQDH